MNRNTVVSGIVCFLAFSPSSFADDCDTSGDWTMFNHDLAGTRNQTSETTLKTSNVGHLRKLWQIDTLGAVTGTPAISENRLYIGDWGANFYKLRASDGGHVWTTPVIAPISASAMVQSDRVVFGDQGGFIYGLDKTSGAIKWQIRPNDHPQAAIFSSPMPLGSSFVLGISSNEEQAAVTPGYPCCTFRGSVIMADTRTGRLLWQTYFISEAESAAGAAGATVFGSPTYDQDLDLIFVATSNNYSAPATSRSDAFFALNPRTGRIVWEKQVIKNDISNFTIPWHEGIDAGIGDSPQVYRLPNGRKVIGAGSKIGRYFVLDAATGALLYDRKIMVSGSLGGLWESAVANGVVFAPGIDWDDPFDFVTRANGGVLTAFAGDTSRVLWQLKTPHSINQGAVAVANSVVYAASCDPGTGSRLTDDVGTLLAVNAATGAVLARVPLGHCASSGTTISDGKVYVGTGNMFQFDTIPPGTVAALGL